jgi:hypothetical protein
MMGGMDAPPSEVVTIADTLRLASKWMPSDTDRRMLLEAAENAETYWDAATCPVCEEPGRCDDDCPLRQVRAGLPTD